MLFLILCYDLWLPTINAEHVNWPGTEFAYLVAEGIQPYMCVKIVLHRSMTLPLPKAQLYMQK
jgi:hypothetical protein